MTASATLGAERAPTVHIESELLGPLAFSGDDVITFPAGLFGFPDSQRFALLPAARERLFWLQSLDHGALAFLLVDPFAYFEDYAVDLGAGDLRDLEADGDSAVVVLAIVTLPGSRDESPTVNLQGPLAIHLAARKGKQVAIADPAVGVRRAIQL